MQHKHTAQGLASLGRGPDTELVHMTKGEVHGLQKLAQAHGGSLTINPDTGLPEAGILSSILPMVAGAALMATGVGAPLAALMVGGGMTVATGSLQKGLMAGLGAYGGAGLAGGLMGAGAGAEAALGVPMNGAGSAVGSAGAAGDFGLLNPVGATGGVGGGYGGLLGSGDAATNAFGLVNNTAAAVPPIQADLAVQTITQAPVTPPTPDPSFLDRLSSGGSQMWRGAESLGTSGGRDAFLGNAASKGVEATGVGGLGGLAKYGMAAAAPMLMGGTGRSSLPSPIERKAFEYSYDPGRVRDPQEGYTGPYSGERTYFNPTFTRTAAGGGLMDVHARFAEGGTTGVKPVEDNPYYSMTGQSADAFKYLMGQGARPETQTTGFFNGGFGGASPGADGTFGGTVIPGGGGFFGPGVGTAGSGNTYTFDPNTGLFTRTAAPELGAVGSGSGLLNAFYGGGYDGGPSDVGGGGGFGGGTSPAGGFGSGMSAAGDHGSAAADGVGVGVGVGDGVSLAQGGITALAHGGASHLGDYSDGGRLLRGPGDGVSDSIPATISGKQPARLADGEFVIPARIVSELGNGSTEAGAKQLYSMLDRVQKARAKTTGKNKVAANSNAAKLLPA